MSNKMLLITGLLVLAAFIGGSRWANLQVEEKSQGQEEAPIIAGETVGEEAQVLGVQDQTVLTEGALITKGNPEAKVTMVEFSEYQCPFCARYVADAYQKIWQAYGKDIYYIWRDFPLSFHQNSVPAAVAARCAGQQGQYWEMHDQLFTDQETWSESLEPEVEFAAYAQKLSLNGGDFSACIEDEEIKSLIEADFKLGQQMGVSGTPAFFINGQRLVGAQPFEAFKAVIDQELAN